MKLIDILNEIKVKPAPPNLLELIQNNINGIEYELALYESRNIHWVAKNPQEVAMKSFWDNGEDEANVTVFTVFFKFLDDAQSDPFYDEDDDGELRTILIDGAEIAYRFFVF
jgi:hypothetical protein